jgi:hypothetical protein
MKKLIKAIFFCVSFLMLTSSYATPPAEINSITNSYLYQGLQSIFSMANNALKNRIFIGQLAGFAILPVQLLHNQRYAATCTFKFCYNDRVELVEVIDGSLQMKLIICYPPNWNKNDTSKCSVFCNPNGALIANYINATNRIDDNCIISELLKNGPVVLFDYPNTGINYGINESTLTYYIPFLKYTTENQILDYSQAVLNYAAKRFNKITVAGISLGGAVATITLSRYLQQNTDIDYNRFRLINIDSFTSIPRVVFASRPRLAKPNMLMLADVLGYILGVNMDAQTSMEYLINHNINIFVFNHEFDKVIPLLSRMTQYTTDFKEKLNITSTTSEDSYRRYTHGFLDGSLKKQLHLFLNKTN